MAIFSNIPRGRDFWGWPPVLLGLAVVAGLLTLSAIRIIAREREISRERAAIEAKLQALEAEKRRLEETIRELGSPEAVERIAKETLNLKKEGEEVVVVVPPESSTRTPPDERGFLGGWIGALFKFFVR